MKICFEFCCLFNYNSNKQKLQGLHRKVIVENALILLIHHKVIIPQRIYLVLKI